MDPADYQSHQSIFAISAQFTCFQFLFPNIQKYGYLHMYALARIEYTKFYTVATLAN